MNFISPIMLRDVTARCPQLLKEMERNLKYNVSEFSAACKTEDCETVDRIISENLMRLTETKSIRPALHKLSEKFPELNIQYTSYPKEMIKRIDEHSNDMLRIAKERNFKTRRTKNLIESIIEVITNIKAFISYILNLSGLKKTSSTKSCITEDDIRAIKAICTLAKIYKL